MEKAAIGIVPPPAVAFAIAFVAMYLVFGVQKLSRWHDDHPVFTGLQLVSAAAASFTVCSPDQGLSFADA